MVLDAAQMGAWVWYLKTDEVIDLGNSSEILGFPRLDSFHVFESALHPDDRERVRENIASAIQTGRYDSEFRTVRTDGEIRWFRAIGSVLSDDAGDPTQMAGVNFDITEKKRIEQALLKSEKLAAGGPARCFRLARNQ